jgi:hypothetical protein
VNDHISDLKWDRLLAGELTAVDADAVRAHAADCGSCSERLREITVERDAFADRPIPIAFARARKTRWWLGAPVAAIVAAAIVLLVLWRRPGPDEELVKGSGLFLFAGKPGELQQVEPGAIVHPGTYLQAAYTADRDGYGAVLSKDGAGTASLYVPAAGAMVALPPGSKVPFPQSTELDDVLGAETIVVVWCATAQPIEPLLAQLRATGTVSAPEGCRASAFALEKR